MRTLRLSLVGMFTLALLGGPGAMVVAQDDPMAPAFVTGTVVSRVVTDSGSVSSVDGATLTEGFQGTSRWEASDPRLNGTESYTGNWLRFGAGGFQVETATRIVENADGGGRWVGTTTALVGPGVNTDTVILRGEGAYEGLTAYVLIDYETGPFEFVGAIFPGELPTMPEPVELAG